VCLLSAAQVNAALQLAIARDIGDKAAAVTRCAKDINRLVWNYIDHNGQHVGKYHTQIDKLEALRSEFVLVARQRVSLTD
jgi:hypothetical protein